MKETAFLPKAETTNETEKDFMTNNFAPHSRPVAEPQRSITIPPVMSLTMAAEYDSDPHRLAGLYLHRRCFRIPDDLTLYYWRAEYWRWNGRRYLKISKNELRAEISREVKKEFNQLAAGKNPPERPKRVTSGLVSNVLQAASSIVLVPENEELPLWIGPSQDAKPFFSMANGLVDLAALVKGEGDPLHPHTPKWFTPVSFPSAWRKVPDVAEVFRRSAGRRHRANQPPPGVVRLLPNAGYNTMQAHGAGGRRR